MAKTAVHNFRKSSIVNVRLGSKYASDIHATYFVATNEKQFPTTGISHLDLL